MRRVVVKLFVFLLLGAIVNVAVAWGCTTWAHLNWPNESSWWTLDAYESLEYPCGVDARARAITRTGTGFGVKRMTFTIQCYPTHGGRKPWRGVHELTAPARGSMSAGWPVRSVVGFVNADHGLFQRQWCLKSPFQEEPVFLDAKSDWRDLPLRPIWPGFAINTIFYAVILWLLFAAPFALRRWRRVRKGLCPKCAYPIGESTVCTECGQSIITSS